MIFVRINIAFNSCKRSLLTYGSLIIEILSVLQLQHFVFIVANSPCTHYKLERDICQIDQIIFLLKI